MQPTLGAKCENFTHRRRQFRRIANSNVSYDIYFCRTASKVQRSRNGIATSFITERGIAICFVGDIALSLITAGSHRQYAIMYITLNASIFNQQSSSGYYNSWMSMRRQILMKIHSLEMYKYHETIIHCTHKSISLRSHISIRNKQRHAYHCTITIKFLL